jgi:GNAT superfamily N-acetyltransferase
VKNTLGNDMEYVENYMHNSVLRGHFNALTQEVYGFTFENWYQKGFWDNRYVCHSYIDGDRMLSNVSTTEYDVYIEGMKYTAIQIGTVMTKPEFRGEGLSVRLIEKVLEKYKPNVDFIYLFGHKDVWNYYSKQGFTPIMEANYCIDFSLDNSRKNVLRKLSIDSEEDVGIIREIAKRRVPVSEAVGVVNDESVLLFYCQIAYQENIVYIPGCEAIIIFTFDETGMLYLHDVLSSRRLKFSEISESLSSEVSNISKIWFGFTPTFEDLVVSPKYETENDKMFFIGNESILPKAFRYPIIAHT